MINDDEFQFLKQMYNFEALNYEYSNNVSSGFLFSIITIGFKNLSVLITYPFFGQ